MALQVTQGTQTPVYTLLNGGTEIQVVKLDVGGGTNLQDFSTIGGQLGMRHTDAFATVVSTGTNTLGTIKAGVSGSVIYVTDLIVSVGSASNVEFGNGGTSLPLIGTLALAANGGAVMNFRTPLATSAGSALVYKQSAAISPLSITALGFID